MCPNCKHNNMFFAYSSEKGELFLRCKACGYDYGTGRYESRTLEKYNET